ncbi:aldo/keto reductase [Actinoplanes sp. NPDC023801]|uniref:aldo/keto reductase n=1 Tax=Actinoplanes sp. NPDC023801 TaxID=3154595 RepID=UPI0033D432A1
MTNPAMPMARLGRNGPVVSRLALGAMTFGAETTEAEAHRQLDLFVERGGTFVDTADVYANGLSEEIIGRWGKQRGGTAELVIATKGRFGPPAGSHGGSRRAVVRAVDDSLRRLQLDTIDVYYMHGWDRHTDVEETLSTLGDLVRSGKIHYLAWSNVSGWQLQRIVSTARMLGVPVPVALQPQYNLLDRGIEVEVLPCAVEAGLSLIPWSPLGGGWLTGKYTRDSRPVGATRLGEDPDRGVEAYGRRNTERTYAILDVVRAIADRIGRPMGHVALAWLLSRPGVSSLLLGARTAEQLETNLGAAGLELEAEDLQALTGVSAFTVPSYPYQFLAEWSEMRVWDELGCHFA